MKIILINVCSLLNALEIQIKMSNYDNNSNKMDSPSVQLKLKRKIIFSLVINYLKHSLQ